VAIVNVCYLKEAGSKKMKTWVLILSFIAATSALLATGANHVRGHAAVVTQALIEPPSKPMITSVATRGEAEPSGVKPLGCLPKDVRADEVVTYSRNKSGNVTVAKKLLELKSRCRRGKLVDARGREIRFFSSSCWGNPPPDYMEIQQQEAATLANLKKRYAVIVFGCSLMTH
jgi:hypothetical protein